MSDLTIPPDRPPVQVPPADTPGVQGLLTLAVAVVVVAGLYLGREVMIPIILAVLLSFLLAPLVNVLRRMHLGRVPSVLLAVVLALGVILTFAAVIGTQLAELAPDVPRYASAVQQKVDTAQQILLGRVATIVRRLGRQLDNADTAKTSEAGPATPDASAKNEQKAIPCRDARAGADDRAARPADPRADRRSAVVHGHRLHRRDLHPAAARGPARPADPAVRFERPASNHRRDERRGAAAVQILSDAARHQRDVRCHRRHGPVLHRGAIAGAVGRARDAAALRALHRGAARGHGAADACGRGRSWLVDGAVDGRALCHWRGDHGPGGRADAVRAEHRALAVFGGGGGSVLDLAMGARRPHSVDAADAVPGRARPPRGAAGIPRHHPWRPAAADTGRELLSAHSGR